MSYNESGYRILTHVERQPDGIEGCRKCSRFYCNMMGERRCCADCPRKQLGVCIDPCLNDPERCGLELKGD